MTACTLGHRRSRKRKRRNIDINFAGGDVSTIGGIELVRAADDQLSLIDSVATCLPDPRNPDRITHQWDALLRQRIYALEFAVPNREECHLFCTAAYSRRLRAYRAG